MNVDYCVNYYNAEYISSRSNPKIVLFSKLSDKKNREEYSLFLAEGIKLSEEALKYADVDKLLVSESALKSDERVDSLVVSAAEKHIDIIILADQTFEKVSTEKSPQGIIAITKYTSNVKLDSDFLEWQKDKRLLMLDGIRDPGNLGTILRSAEALGIEGVVLNDCADVFNNKTVRAAMGTIFRLPVFVTKNGANLVRSMKKLGRRVIGASLGEHTLVLGKYDTDPTDCPVIGNEGHGISGVILTECDFCVMIPMSGNTESLNAAQAATCILWEYHR